MFYFIIHINCIIHICHFVTILNYSIKFLIFLQFYFSLQFERIKKDLCQGQLKFNYVF